MQTYHPMTNHTMVKTPQAKVDSQPYSNPTFYRQLVGDLQYLIITRSDFSFFVNCLCQHMHRPLNLHFKQLKRVLCFIKASSNGLCIQMKDLSLLAYSDSDWIGAKSHEKSTILHSARFFTHLLGCQKAKHCC